MNFNRLDETLREKVAAYSISGIIIIAFYFFMRALPQLGKIFHEFWVALAPFIYGFCFAFILKPLRDIVEKKWLKNKNWKDTTKRKVAVTICIITMFIVLSAFFAVLIPQLFSSAKTLISSLDSYEKLLEEMIMPYAGEESTIGVHLENIFNTLSETLTKWITDADGAISILLSYSWQVITLIFNFFIGVIVAIYLLSDTERFARQFNSVLYAVLPENRADDVSYVLGLCGNAFNRFIFGKALDSLIIGIVCYIVVAILDMPYSPLIAFVVGITNMIPVFGPFLGAIPCIFILLIIAPIKGLEFAVFILILQQIDGNILGPYILGDAIGLPALWVMFAIIIGGAMFGHSGHVCGSTHLLCDLHPCQGRSP